MISKKNLIREFQEIHKRLYGYYQDGASKLSKSELESGIMNMNDNLDAIITMSNFEDDWNCEDEVFDRIFGL